MRHGHGFGGIAAAAVVAVGLTAAPTSVTAQDYLTLEETRQCLIAERQLQQQRREIDARGPALEQEAARLDQMAAEISEQRRRVDVRDRALTAEYERLRERHIALYNQYMQAAAEYDSLAQTYNDDLANYNAHCTGRIATEHNLQRARSELGLN